MNKIRYKLNLLSTQFSSIWTTSTEKLFMISALNLLCHVINCTGFGVTWSISQVFKLVFRRARRLFGDRAITRQSGLNTDGSLVIFFGFILAATRGSGLIEDVVQCTKLPSYMMLDDPSAIVLWCLCFAEAFFVDVAVTGIMQLNLLSGVIRELTPYLPELRLSWVASITFSFKSWDSGYI